MPHSSTLGPDISWIRQIYDTLNTTSLTSLVDNHWHLTVSVGTGFGSKGKQHHKHTASETQSHKKLSMQCNAMQCNAMQCNAMQSNTMQCNAMQYNAMRLTLGVKLRNNIKKLLAILVIIRQHCHQYSWIRIFLTMLQAMLLTKLSAILLHHQYHWQRRQQHSWPAICLATYLAAVLNWQLCQK